MTYVPRDQQRADQAVIRQRIAALAEKDRREKQLAAQQEEARVFLLTTLVQAQHRDHALVAAAGTGISIRELSRLTGLHRSTIASILSRSALADR
jgi:hypothetical protein